MPAKSETTGSAKTIRVTEYERGTISYIAAEEYKRANGDATAAVDAMLERITSDDELFRMIATPLLRTACSNAIYQVMSQIRREAFGNGNGQPSREVAHRASQRAIKARAQAALRGLLAFPLSDGTLLGNAVYEQVFKTASRLLKTSATMGHEGRWLMLVADKIKARPREIVSRQLKLGQLEQLKEQARASV
jgi:hypothetical protein